MGEFLIIIIFIIMLFLICLVLSDNELWKSSYYEVVSKLPYQIPVKNKVYYKGQKRCYSTSNNKVVLVKVSFLSKLKSRLSNPSVIISIIYTLILGFISRYLILTYLLT
jgi:hypothetical protein